jgi:hypothetical protein
MPETDSTLVSPITAVPRFVAPFPGTIPTVSFGQENRGYPPSARALGVAARSLDLAPVPRHRQ